MAGGNEVTFYGGPCDGVTRAYTSAQIRPGVLSCGGIQYVLQGQAPQMYVAQPLHQDTPTSGTAATFAPDLFRAYHRLTQAIGSQLRPAITQARRYDQLALQSLARHHKVRRR